MNYKAIIASLALVIFLADMGPLGCGQRTNRPQGPSNKESNTPANGSNTAPGANETKTGRLGSHVELRA